MPSNSRISMLRLVLLVLVGFFLSTTDTLAEGIDCEQLKALYERASVPNSGLKAEFTESLGEAIRNDEVCAKNLYGRAMFEGVIFEKNALRAYSVFMDLAQREYPPAMYNIALMSIKERMNSPEVVLSILHGIIVKYTADEDWGYLAADARELGWDFLRELRADGRENFDALYSRHSDVSSMGVRQTTVLMAQLKQSADRVANVFMAILLLGAMANSYNAASLYAPPPNIPVMPYQPQFYTLHAVGPNYLYVIPH